ncbi:MAG: sulfotransferase [Mycobacteriales bacterium]
MPQQVVRTSDSPLQGRLVFVVGAPRSGTTWLQRALGAHPDVLVLPSETHLFSAGISQLRDQAQGGHVGSPSTGTWFMTAAAFAGAARAFCDAALGGYVQRVQPEAERVVERSPTHVWHLGLIADVYPDAYVVHIVRDGRDVVRSQVAQDWGPSTVQDAAAAGASARRSARAAAPRLERYLEVRYEELLARPADISRVFDFLGLDPVPAADQAALESGRAVNVDPTRPDVAAGKWRRDWSAADVAAFEAAAGEALVEAGYERLPAAPAPAAAAGPARPARRRRRRATAPARPSGEWGQRAVDRVLAALATGDPEPVLAGLAPLAEVRVRRGPDAWRALGDDGARRLREALVAEGPWGEPERGEQHLDGATWTVVLAHRDPDGQLVERLLQLTLDGDHRVAQLRLTRFGA